VTGRERLVAISATNNMKGQMMKKKCVFGICVLLLGAASTINADRADSTVIVTSSNANANELLVYDAQSIAC